MSGASERANRQASVPVLQSVFLAVLDHGATTATPIGNRAALRPTCRRDSDADRNIFQNIVLDSRVLEKIFLSFCCLARDLAVFIIQGFCLFSLS